MPIWASKGTNRRASSYRLEGDSVASSRTTAGGCVGDPYIARSFTRAFHPSITQWQHSQIKADPVGWKMLYTTRPVNDQITHLSLTKYADDLSSFMGALTGCETLPR